MEFHHRILEPKQLEPKGYGLRAEKNVLQRISDSEVESMLLFVKLCHSFEVFWDSFQI